MPMHSFSKCLNSTIQAYRYLASALQYFCMLDHTMSSWVLLRKPTPNILSFAAQSLNQRLIFTKSNSTSSSPALVWTGGSSSYNDSEKGGSLLGLILSSLSSGALIVGSSLGLCYLASALQYFCMLNHTMSSWVLLRKPTPNIRSFAAQSLNQRLIFTKSNRTSSSPALVWTGGSSSYNDSKKGGSLLGLILRSLSSGALIVGSSLGLCYCSTHSDRNSFVCYADSGSGTTEPEKKPKFLFKDAYRRRVFFKYERRLRAQSPPEKVFEYFASFQSPSGEIFMTPADLMRAVVPVFPSSEAAGVRAGCLKGEPIHGELNCAPSEFFMLFDTDNDGLISFAEYIFFVTLLSIPGTSFSVAFKMFDLDNDGEIDKQEFKKVMGLMRTHSRQGTRHRDGLRIGLKVSSSVENGGLLEYFFGKDGERRLEHASFVQFLRDLHDEILRLEFAHYDSKSQGAISAKDFALSMVASADMSHIDKFLDRVDELSHEPHLRDARITFEEFKNFDELRKQLQPFSLAVFSYGKVNGLLTKQDLQRAASQVSGISLTDNLVDMIFYMFDTNRDGRLSSKEFLRVLHRRETLVS